MAKSPDFKEAYNQDLNTDYMPPRNPKSVLYTVKTKISPDKKHTCLEMKYFFCRSFNLGFKYYFVPIRNRQHLVILEQKKVTVSFGQSRQSFWV